ncbi:type IV-A pilus assembly ATPase PilB [Desulfofustis limnaeus]|jgi:type IV pilus assembly protein PilB|uniref:Type IV-A pilus assembly ATPase PilB n=1 Tax=Desulfofustis limnaeus TaxID=2740163 RepID=A0ABM7W824_9BACT|nr:type IV-A pilus assembly ATPase PilB [Desulfofustis limnaeus]MDX9894566.1 type IV-A pilus assembly ATPase PilB [Desulfofustis sp.]BDD87072.1 type IV-A pilus assembly ATPase PilB [Desulfofustis limnaeus]
MATSATMPRKSSIRKTVKDQSGAGRIKLGELMSKAGYITATQFETAKREVQKNGARMGAVLRQLEYIDEDTVFNFLSRQHNYPPAVIKNEPPSPEAIKLMTYELAKKYMAFPLRMAGNTLQVTMAEPSDATAVEELQDELGKELSVCVSTERDIVEAYKKYYGIDDEEAKSFFAGEDAHEEISITEVDDFGAIVAEAADTFEIETGEDDLGLDQFNASDAPIIKLVNGILVKAVQEGVSDIHVEPYERSMQVRYRKDGSLYKSMNLPLTIKNAMIARVKILSGLDITERRIPQDGRIKMRMGKNRSVDFRVSSLPTLFGESVVLRILDKSSLNVDLTQLGFEKNTFEMLKRCLARPQGLLLVTGPTGSGKTVTLYSALNSLNSEDIKILTAEDPVEFNFKGINQVNVHQEVGMTFAAALKAFLRQDPDIIMVGEIRDYETAEIAIKAAMTGHLVFSTLHTNDSAATIGRLVDIGVPPYMIASSVTMVLSQRLGRRLCQKCKRVMEHDPKELVRAGFREDELAGLTIYGAVGCPECNGLGYRGRVGFFELMEVTEEVAKAISAEVPEDQLRKIAIQEGMTPLRQAALLKVKQGITSVEEALRRTVAHEESMPAYLINPDVEEYEDGDVIIREGNRDIDFFKLIRGALTVVKGGKKIAELTEPGEYFGEMAAISGEQRTASIISQGRSTIKRFPGDKLDEIIHKYPEVSSHLFKTMTTRLHKSNQIIVKLAGGGQRKPPPPGSSPRPAGT